MDFLDNDVNKEIEKVTKFYNDYNDYNDVRNPLGFSYLDNEKRKFFSNLNPLQIMNFCYILGYNDCVELANKEIESLKKTEKERTMDYFLDLFAEKIYNKIKEKK